MVYGMLMSPTASLPLFGRSQRRSHNPATLPKGRAAPLRVLAAQRFDQQRSHVSKMERLMLATASLGAIATLTAQAALASPQLQQLTATQLLHSGQTHTSAPLPASHRPTLGDLADNPVDSARDRAGSAAQQLKDNLPAPNIPSASNTMPGAPKETGPLKDRSALSEPTAGGTHSDSPISMLPPQQPGHQLTAQLAAINPTRELKKEATGSPSTATEEQKQDLPPNAPAKSQAETPGVPNSDTGALFDFNKKGPQ